MIILIFFVVHWYTSLFFQSVFHHRYAAHGMYSMSKFWERVFYIGCFITQGSSYISARAYGVLHRLHHAHTDQPDDPHSPSNDPNLFLMMWNTRNNYYAIYKGRTEVPAKFMKDLPDWKSFDRFAHNWYARSAWIAAYTLFYFLFATEWWMFLLLPVTISIGSFQGAAVNYWAHWFGYVNFKQSNTSKNILPVDPIFWGESFHNNHHQHPGRPNNAHRWFEVDMGYLAMRVLDWMRIIRLKPVAA